MNRTLLTLAMASLFATGCGHAAPALKTAASSRASESAESASKKPGKSAEESAAKELPAKPIEEGNAAASGGDTRKPGDFVVYRFSGSFRKIPLKLTQRVVDRRGDVLTIDVAAEAGDQKREFRVQVNDAPGMKNEVLHVARLDSGVEKPASPDAYESLMAETALAADQNEAFLGAEDVVLDVGGALLPCHKASYRVLLGKKPATLRTLSSDGFAWGDVGGEITAIDGKVLYRAEVVEAGHTDSAEGPAMAHAGDAP